jgi:hypothetical protein
MALSAGCAHSEKHKREEASTAGGIPAPTAPPFVNGAMALVLTNVDGFRARAVLEAPPTGNRNNTIAGELMGRGGKLFFAPGPGASADKHSRAEDFSYIWNVEENRGFLLNGPLQGYAPVSSSTPFTNVVVASGGNNSAPEKAGGYLCQKSDVKVMASDGTESELHVWRARELKGMAVRVTGTVNGAPLTLGLSKIRFEPPPEDLFVPPADFTKYTSAEMMMNELVARQQNQKRKRGWEPPPSDEVGAGDVHAPGRPQ